MVHTVAAMRPSAAGFGPHVGQGTAVAWALNCIIEAMSLLVHIYDAELHRLLHPELAFSVSKKQNKNGNKKKGGGAARRARRCTLGPLYRLSLLLCVSLPPPLSHSHLSR